MPKMPPALMNRIALVLFVSALASFVAFHFVRFTIFIDPAMSSVNNIGWTIWSEFSRIFRKLYRINWQEMMLFSGFLTNSLLFVSSPFLVAVLRSSRLSWWIGILASGAATIGFSGVLVPLIISSETSVPGPGCFFLFSAMLLNFLGFFFIRREIPPNPVIDAA